MPNYYPVYLNLEGRRCIVIGGGDVAERKIQHLLECGARVGLISPEATPVLQDLAQQGQIEWVQKSYEPGDLKDAFLAIAATDDSKVNREIYFEAERSKVLLNVVDVTRYCVFIAPAIVRQGDITLAISTGGTSPALARRIREELQGYLTKDYADLAKVLAQVRAAIRRQGVVVQPDVWQDGIKDGTMDLITKGLLEEAKERLIAFLVKSAQKSASDSKVG